MKNKIDLILKRYIILVILTIFFLSDLFIFLISKLYVYLVYIITIIFTNVQIFSNSIIFTNFNTEFRIVKECIAPSAYILMIFIFITMPLELNKNLKIILKLLIIFSIFNIIRILILIFVYLNFGQIFFDKYHFIFYEFVSIIVTIGIIIYFYKKEKLESKFPIINDFKYIISFIKR